LRARLLLQRGAANLQRTPVLMGDSVLKTSNGSDPRFAGRVVVVSPHLDDAVMSLGATIAKAVQAGTQIEILTVFAYKPSSNEPAGPWDTSCGYTTEGQAADSRRAEDRKACLALGAEPRWMSFGAEPYQRGASNDEIWSAVDSATRGADLVLLPGYPLKHPDHAELSQLLLTRGLSCRAVALYAEQPYSFDHRSEPPGSAPVDALQAVTDKPLVWTRVSATRAHRRSKLEAVSAYRSQLRHLGLGEGVGFFRLRYLLWHEAAGGGEAVAWLS
jgi:LmbE family N-acetylglucosaminyl deacetylase